jgi:hypothetical protein
VPLTVNAGKQARLDTQTSTSSSRARSAAPAASETRQRQPDALPPSHQHRPGHGRSRHADHPDGGGVGGS